MGRNMGEMGLKYRPMQAYWGRNHFRAKISQEMSTNEQRKKNLNFFFPESGIPDPDFPGFTIYEFRIF